jgi:hypothetical protein
MKSINKTPAKSNKFEGVVIGDDEEQERTELVCSWCNHSLVRLTRIVKVKVGFVETVLLNLILMMNELAINKSYRFPTKILNLQ